MEKTQKTDPRKTSQKDWQSLFRISVVVIAILALSAALVYMFRSVILEVNATNRLLADAFMSYQPIGTEAPITTKTPETTEQNVATGGKDTIPIVSAKLSESKAGITNYTSYAIDEKALLTHTFDLYSYSAAPLVLIVHGHATEAYAPIGATDVAANHPFESADPTNNVFAVGEAIAEVLTASGIGVIHPADQGLSHDEMIKKYLALYPSLRFVLDVHRDGLYTSDGRIVRSDGKIGNDPAAELMLAVGTAVLESGTPWQTNLAAAYKLSDMIASAESSVMRKTLLRPESLSQQYAPCSLSLYVGTTGNTLPEALTSARFFARYYAIFILSAVTL